MQKQDGSLSEVVKFIYCSILKLWIQAQICAIYSSLTLLYFAVNGWFMQRGLLCVYMLFSFEEFIIIPENFFLEKNECCSPDLNKNNGINWS